MKKKIIIVGGGITGSALSSIIDNKKFDIEIFDNSKTLGGIIKDINIDGDFFFNGCHLLDDSKWLRSFIKIYNDDFIKIKLLHSSYSNIFGHDVFDEKIAHPTFDKKINTNEIKSKTNRDLYDRLSSYPGLIGSSLNEWVKKFVDSKKISSDMAKIFHINRVFFKKNIDEIKDLKKKDKFFDELLGDYKETNNYFFLPKNGFTNFLINFEKYLTNKGVKINLNSPISINLNSNTPKLYCRKKEIKYDKVIWAANPIILTSKLGIKYKNLSIDYSIVVAEIDGFDDHQLNHYYQVYDKDSKIVRFFVYNINKTKISIEILNEKISKENLSFYQEKIRELLKKIFRKEFNLNNINFQNFKRFGYYSNENLKQLNQLYKFFESKNFIIRGIHLTQQELKINELFNNFKNS